MTEQRNANLYLYERAEAELRMTQKAQAPEAVRIHYELANLYLDRFYNPNGVSLRREDR